MAYGFNNDKSKADVYTEAEVNELLTGKANASHTHDDRYFTESEVTNKLNLKANLASPTFTGTPKATTASQGDGSTRIATTAYVDTGLSGKANSSHTHDNRYYTESEIDTKLNGKANASHTHDDRYYTESEVTNKLNLKADKSDLYYSAGDVISMSNHYPMIGYITDGKENIYITLPVRKSLANISSNNLSLTKMIGAIIGDQGYVTVHGGSATGHSTNWTNLLVTSPSVDKIDNYHIGIIIHDDDGFDNITNNRPLVYVPTSGGINITTN